jgi:glutamate synthase (NADPH/NADH) large chain
VAVVEGAGDHCCEYMTGGAIIVLGNTGLNFGAGMTGGFAMIYDEDGQFAHRYNNELIDIHRITNESTEQYRQYLREKIEEHVKLTGSARGAALLKDFDNAVAKIYLAKPKAIKLDDLLKD